MGKLMGKVALVTGGGRGIGRGTALALAQQGASVAVLARSRNEVDAVAADIEARGGKALAVIADVSIFNEVAQAINEVATTLGDVDILINNAAIVGPIDALANTDPEAWAKTQRVNLEGAYYCLRLVLPGMLAKGWGRVVNVSSGAARGSGILRAGAYSVSKAALDMLARSVAAEVGAQGVFVTSVYPGVVDTTMQTEIRETPVEKTGTATAKRFQQYYESGVLTDAEEVGELIAAMVLSDLHGLVVDVRDPEYRRLLDDILSKS